MKTACIFFLALFLSQNLFAQEEMLVPLAGNTFSTLHVDGGKTITNNGIENWTDSKETFTCYVRMVKTGKLNLTVHAPKPYKGSAVVIFGVNGQTKEVTFHTQSPENVIIGTWDIVDTGYLAIHIKGKSKTENNFPVLSEFKISGTAVAAGTQFVKNNEGNFYYWGRRGPSVHLNYQVPATVNASWYYNEVTVPAGEDIIGSYFMAIGFGEGYFGIQVNDEKERRVLFSVWSPFNTDNPASIPKDQKISMLKKGNAVHAGEFGNEGSGGQSYLKYSWKAGNTYKFLLHGEPAADSTTAYTAWFFAPELNKWQLIASFKRPHTQTYLKRFHSFLENFIPENGDLTREVFFNNQWVAEEDGNWTEVNTAKFTTDNTGNVKYRMDFSGGVKKGQFFLKNCGFFDDYTQPKTIFTRPASAQKPEVNLKELQ